MLVLVLHFFNYRNHKETIKKTQNKKKHNKIVILARSKLNSIESVTSKALIDNETIHEDFTTIINGKKLS